MEPYIKKSLYALTLLAILALTVPAYAETGKIVKTFPVNKGGTLVIDSNLGSIYIDTWDRDEVSVLVRRRASSKQRVKGFEVQIERRGNDIYVKGENRPDNLVSVDFCVNIPKEYSVDLKTGEGSIDLGDIKGNVKAKTSGDSVKLGDVKGGVKVDTSGGSIQMGKISGKSCINEAGCSI